MGNAFHPDYLTRTSATYFTSKTVLEVYNHYQSNKQHTVSQTNFFQIKQEPYIIHCRYNPFNDKSVNNKIYVVSNHSDHTTWQPPPDKPDVQRTNLPIWLETWGYLDWIRKSQIVSQPDINYVCVLQSDYIVSTPKLPFYVPIDTNMTDSPPSSPYIGQLTPADELHFYPKNYISN